MRIEKGLLNTVNKPKCQKGTNKDLATGCHVTFKPNSPIAGHPCMSHWSNSGMYSRPEHKE